VAKSSPTAGAEEGIDLAVNLVNTWDLLEHPPEVLRDAERLRRLLLRSGHGDLVPLASESDLEPMRELRTRIREVLEAPEATAALELNRLLIEVGAVPQLVRRDGRWVIDYSTADPNDLTGKVAARAAAGLLDLVRRGGWGRVGICPAAPCCCMYVDRSKNRSRIYCSDLCSDRVAQAAYRRRKRQRSSKKK
jgi:predicted RNA-binding Zn ribbon-like protein